MNGAIPVAIVGAGPYGLSLAAHLRAAGVDVRIFGPPMETWLRHMPKGMLLKSDGFASSLSAPDPSSSLRAYCAAQGLPYADTEFAVPLATFTDYALDFQRRQVPGLETSTVVALERAPAGFRLTLDDGGSVEARQVVLAVGITHFDSLPKVLQSLPADLVTHSSAHHDLEPFRGRDVTVIGAGSSAVDLAALLNEAGARPRLVARASTVRFFSAPTGRAPGLWTRLRHPQSGLGPGLRSRLCADFPWLFRHLPAGLRVDIVRRHLGPASAWSLKDRVVGRVPILTGHDLEGAEAHGGGVRLSLRRADGTAASFDTEHVIAATGYRPDLARLTFIDAGLRAGVATVDGAPALSAHFESSLPGLFFMGPAAANSFGPLMRFMVGAGFAARQVSRRLGRSGR